MIINEINILGFGSIKNRVYKFKEGLNLLYGANESGKTTVMAFIKFMFYGVKIRKAPNDITFKEKYTPWDGSPMSGSMTVTDDDGKMYIIERHVSGGKNQLSVLDGVSGANIKNSDITGDVGKYFTHLGEEAFSYIAFLSGLSGVVHSDRGGEIVAKLTNIGESGFEDVSYTNSVNTIKNEIADLSSEKRKNAVIPDLNRDIEEIDKKIRELESETRRIKEYESNLEEMKHREKLLFEKLSGAERAKNENSDNIKSQLLNDLNMLEHSQYIRFGSVTDDERQITDENTYTLKKAVLKGKEKIREFLLVIGLFVLFAAFSGFVNPYLFIFSFAGAVLSAWAYTAKKYIIREINELDEKRNIIFDKYECKNASEFSRGLREYESICMRIEMIKSEIKRIAENNCGSNSNVADGKNISYDFTSRDNNVKIEMLRNELDLLRKNFVLCEQKLFDLKNCFPEIEKLNEKKQFLNNQLSKAKFRLKALNVSLEILEEAFERTKREFSPPLAKRAGEILCKLTCGRHSSLLTDEDFCVKLKSDSSYNSSLYYSRGTFEQIYLSLRFALAEIAVRDKKLPLFLDDAFAFYDDDRLLGTLKFVLNESKNKQIFVSSCHSREYLYFRNEDVNLIDFNSERND